jgi:hypothetical protein
MKKYWLTTAAFTLIALFSHAQFYKGLLPGTGDFGDSLSKIVVDFKNNFRKIQGAALPEQMSMNIYESNTTLPGTTQNYIMRSHSENDTMATWQAMVYHGEDYDKALKLYKSTFHKIKNSSIRLSDRSVAHFSGKLRNESHASFQTSSLTIDIGDANYKKFVADVEMISNFLTYEVHINLHVKADDDLTPDD